MDKSNNDNEQKKLFNVTETGPNLAEMLGIVMQEMFIKTLGEKDSRNTMFDKIISEIVTRPDFKLYTADRFKHAFGETKIELNNKLVTNILKELLEKNPDFLREQITKGFSLNKEFTTLISTITQEIHTKEKDLILTSLKKERDEMLSKFVPNIVKIERINVPVVTTLLTHKIFQDVLEKIPFGNVMLIGPSGAGKTHIAGQIAETMKLKFYFNGAISSEYKLSGFIDANSNYVTTPFREAFEKGGVYLFDEIDASSPQALLAFNAALANGHCDFPDGIVTRHKDFYCLAAANTYGHGANRIYVGRNQLDGASLDRFIVIDMDYDEKLERIVARLDYWTDQVQAWRKSCNELEIRHIISTRGLDISANMLRNGLTRESVEKSVIWKGLSEDSVIKIKQRTRSFYPTDSIEEDPNDLPFHTLST